MLPLPLLLSFPPLLLLRLASAQTTTLDDTDPAITYLPSPDDWSTETDQAAPVFEGTLHYVARPDGAITFNFTGTGFQYLGTRKDDRAVLLVTIDGLQAANAAQGNDPNIDQFSETQDTTQQVLGAYIVDDGPHSVTIQNEPGDSRIPNNGIPFMVVDQIIINGTVTNSSTSGTTPPIPTTSLPPSSVASAPIPTDTTASVSSTNSTNGGLAAAGGAAPSSSSSSSGLSTPALAGVITGSVVAFAGIALLASWVARRSVAANTPDGQRQWHQNPKYYQDDRNAARGFDFADADAKSIDSYSVGASQHGHGGLAAMGAGAAAAGGLAAKKGAGTEMRPYPGGGGTPAPAYYPSTQTGGSVARSMSVSTTGTARQEELGGRGDYGWHERADEPRESLAPSAFSGQGGGGLGVPMGGYGATRSSAAPSSFYSRASSIYPDERDSRGGQPPPMPDRDTMYTEGGWSARSYEDRYSTGSGTSTLHRRTGSGTSRDLGGDQGLSIGDRARGRWLYGGTP